jgi:hypothetical protein
MNGGIDFGFLAVTDHRKALIVLLLLPFAI